MLHMVLEHLTRRRALTLLALVVLLLGGLLLVLKQTSAPKSRMARSISSPIDQLGNLGSPAYLSNTTLLSNPNPSPDTLNISKLNDLRGVTAVSPNDVWAVGAYKNNFSISWAGPAQTLTEHWDGASWTVASGPTFDSGKSELSAIAAVSANDIWAVGEHAVSAGFQTLTEHWDGTSWTVVSSPNSGAYYNYLKGIAAVSANDVWAVGYNYNGDGPRHTLVEHWNGKSWSVVSCPDPGTHDNELNGVAALSAKDIWAVGSSGNATLVEHWDGKSWSVVPSPNSGDSYLNAVAAITSSDVWAVGHDFAGALVEHWNGKSWSVVPSPNPGTSDNYLNAVAGLSAKDVWTVGYRYNDTLSLFQTVVERWNGATWSVIFSPDVDKYNNSLKAVAVISANEVWATGDYYNFGNSLYLTLVEHWDGSNFSIVASPNHPFGQK